MNNVTVLEVNQWSSTADNIGQFSVDDFRDKKPSLNGGDSEAAEALFGFHPLIKSVPESAGPSKGNVWFRDGANGKLELWKANYDTSD